MKAPQDYQAFGFPKRLLELRPLNGAGAFADDSGVRDGDPFGGWANPALPNRPPRSGPGVVPDVVAEEKNEGEAPGDAAGFLLVGAALKPPKSGGTGLWPLAAPFVAEDGLAPKMELAGAGVSFPPGALRLWKSAVGFAHASFALGVELLPATAGVFCAAVGSLFF